MTKKHVKKKTGGSKLDAQRNFLTKELVERETWIRRSGEGSDYRFYIHGSRQQEQVSFIGPAGLSTLRLSLVFGQIRASNPCCPISIYFHRSLSTESYSSLCSQGCQSLPKSHFPFTLGSKTPKFFSPPSPHSYPAQKLSFPNFPVARAGLRTESWPRDATGLASPRHVGSSWPFTCTFLPLTVWNVDGTLMVLRGIWTTGDMLRG